MYSTPVFHYIPRQIVVLLSGTSPKAYMQQYAKPLTLHKGVDNQLQFQFLNQEQKRINITSKEITCRILNATGTEVLLSKVLTLQLPATGIAALVLTAADINGIDAQKCYYSLSITEGQFDYPVYVDHNAGGRGDLFIVDSVMPSFVPSVSVSIPTNQVFPSNIANINTTATTFFSSVIPNDGSATLTIQTSYTGYSGNTLIQGSTISNGDWYTVETYPYVDQNTTVGYTVQGFHPYIRLEFIANCGSVNSVFAR